MLPCLPHVSSRSAAELPPRHSCTVHSLSILDAILFTHRAACFSFLLHHAFHPVFSSPHLLRFLTLILFFFLKKTWGTHTSALSQSLNCKYNLTSSFLASSCFVEVVVSQCINTPDASSISARTRELEPFLLCLLIFPLSPHQLEIMTPAHL